MYKKCCRSPWLEKYFGLDKNSIKNKSLINKTIQTKAHFFNGANTIESIPLGSGSEMLAIGCVIRQLSY